MGVDVWWDHELLGGEDFRQRILEIVTRAPVTLVIWSRRSVESQWVIGEASAAREKGSLIPLNIDGANPPLDFRPLHTIDLTSWVPGDNLPETLLDGLGQQLDRHLDYGIETPQQTIVGRTARQVTHAWYLDFESILFFLMAQGFACFLLNLSFANVILSDSPGTAFSGDTKDWLIYGYVALIGLVVAPLVMRPILENRRLHQAVPLYLMGAFLSLPGYVFAARFIAQMKDDVLLLVGPTTIMMLLVSALGHRAMRK